MDAQSWQSRRRRTTSLELMSGGGGGGGGGGIFAQARSGSSASGQPAHEDDERPVEKGEGRSGYGLKRRRAAGAHVAPDDSVGSRSPTDSLAASDARLLRELDAKASAPRTRRGLHREVQVGLGAAEEGVEKEMQEVHDEEQAVEDQEQATFPEGGVDEGGEDDVGDEEEEDAPATEQHEEQQQQQQQQEAEQERELHDNDDDEDMMPRGDTDANKEQIRREYSLPMRAIRELAEHEGMSELMTTAARRRHELTSAVRAMQQSLQDLQLRGEQSSIHACSEAVVRMVSSASALPKPPPPLLVLRSARAVAATPLDAQADEARCEGAFVGAARFVCLRIMQCCDTPCRKVHKLLERIAPKPKNGDAPNDGMQTSLVARLGELSAEMNRLSKDESSFELPEAACYEEDLEEVLDELDAAAERWIPPGRRSDATLPIIYQLGRDDNRRPAKRAAAAAAPGDAPRAKRAAAPDRRASASTSAKRPHAQMDMFA